MCLLISALAYGLSHEKGYFVFADVPPDTYGLVIVCPTGSFLLGDPDTGGDFLITVKSGEQLDLGLLHIPGEIAGVRPPAKAAREIKDISGIKVQRV